MDRITTSPDDDALLSLASDLARRAGAVILSVRARGFEVESKSDRSPVTEADRAAEAVIVDGLRAARPDIPVFAEEEQEAAAADPRDAAPPATYWLVDPLDGTREFAAGSENFTVNVGLVRDGRAVLGAVAVPALGELFCGIVGRGAWKRNASGERRIAARLPPEAGLAVLASRHYASDRRLAEHLRGRRVASVENFGSALKILRIAEGRADLYPRFGRTMAWDTAAPQAVLEAAGGALLRVNGGAPLRYRADALENPDFLCTGLLPPGEPAPARP